MLIHLAMGLGLLLLARMIVREQFHAMGVREITWLLPLGLRHWPRERLGSLLGAMGLGLGGATIMLAALV